MPKIGLAQALPFPRRDVMKLQQGITDDQRDKIKDFLLFGGRS